MFMSMLWETIFQISDTYEKAEVFLIDNRIPALRFGTADKPTVFAGGFGAEEWQSAVILLRFFEQLLDACQNSRSLAGIAVKKALKKRSVVVIPCVCPEKMGDDTAPPRARELQAVAKYLDFHAGNMFVALNGSESLLFSPPSNETKFPHAVTIAKILQACSALPLQEENRLVGARLCAWVSENAAQPSFLISPPSLKASAIERTYRALEETLTVCALL